MKTDAIIYIQVPHQSKVKAFIFSNPSEFTEWLRKQAPEGFSVTTYTRVEFEEANCEGSTGHEVGSDWWNKWVKPGMDLFDEGAETVTEIWHNEVSQEYLPDAGHDEEFSALFRAVDDFNTHYYMGHDEAIRILKIGPSALHHTHKQGEAYRALAKSADDLGWCYDTPEEDNRDYDEEGAKACLDSEGL